ACSVVTVNGTGPASETLPGMSTSKIVGGGRAPPLLLLPSPSPDVVASPASVPVAAAPVVVAPGVSVVVVASGGEVSRKLAADVLVGGASSVMLLNDGACSVHAAGTVRTEARAKRRFISIDVTPGGANTRPRI